MYIKPQGKKRQPLGTMFLMQAEGLVVVVLVFYGPSTHFRSFRAPSVNLSTLFPAKPPRQFTSVHSFVSNWQLPFLNQWKGENGRRNYFMTNLHKRMLQDVRIGPTTFRIPGGCTSNRATAPSAGRSYHFDQWLHVSNQRTTGPVSLTWVLRIC